MLSGVSLYVGLVSNLTPYVDAGSTLFWVIRLIDLAIISYMLAWVVMINGQLHKESVRFKLAFEHAQVAVVMLDAKDEIAYENKTFFKPL